jgi:hypothetical protein
VIVMKRMIVSKKKIDFSQRKMSLFVILIIFLSRSKTFLVDQNPTFSHKDHKKSSTKIEFFVDQNSSSIYSSEVSKLQHKP